MNAPSSTLLSPPAPAYHFGEFRLESDGTLFRDDHLVHLPPRELAALRLLLDHAGRVVTPSEIRDALWGNVHVTPDSILRCMSSLRASLGPEDLIQTLYKRGYRISAPVQRVDEAQPALHPRVALMPFTCGAHVLAELGAMFADETSALLTDRAADFLEVVARDSVFRLAQEQQTAQQIGARLNADFVLAGTVLGLPLHYRVRAEMIRVESGTQIWVEDLLVRRDEVSVVPAQLLVRILFRFGHEAPSAAMMQPPRAGADVENAPRI